LATTRLRALLDDREAQSNRASIRELVCVALLQSKHQTQAQDCFRSVVTDYPLHLAGLFARARLLEQSLVVAPRALPAEATVTTLDEAASERVKLLVALGLDELAAQAFQEEQSKLGVSNQRDRRWQCRNWGAIGYGGRGYAVSSELRELVQLTDEATETNRWAFDCRYPTPYSAIVRDVETRFVLPTDLIYAVMRQESGFRPSVASNANAYGLMQLLPETAARISEELSRTSNLVTTGESSRNRERTGIAELSEPRVNVELGAAYLAKLLAYFGGNLPLAVAAYNAGPKAVALWVSRAQDIPMELFVARIPYAETRNYVERVITNLAMYRYLRNGDAGLPTLSLSLPTELSSSYALY
jgi:soluble lytic murein transglycosylase